MAGTHYLISFADGLVGHFPVAPASEQAAIDQTVERCAATGRCGTLIDAGTYAVIGRVQYRDGGYTFHRETKA